MQFFRCVCRCWNCRDALRHWKLLGRRFLKPSLILLLCWKTILWKFRVMTLDWSRRFWNTATKTRVYAVPALICDNQYSAQNVSPTIALSTLWQKNTECMIWNVRRKLFSHKIKLLLKWLKDFSPHQLYLFVILANFAFENQSCLRIYHVDEFRSVMY